jgi:hypothetical protein
MSDDALRKLLVVLHLVAAVYLGAFLYAMTDSDGAQLAAQVVGFPVLFLTGLLLWQEGRVARALIRRGPVREERGL